MVSEYTVSDLDEFNRIVSVIGRLCDNCSDTPVFSPLWFRGQSFQHYSLIPSLFRGGVTEPNAGRNYSADHLYEDYRYQNFKSRVFHLIPSKPESRIEWQEIMQHHYTKTRLMDWSESSVSALLFALQPFVDPKTDEELRCQRKTLTPVVWVLRPYKLNEAVYDTFVHKESGRYPLIENALTDIIDDSAKISEVSQRLGDELGANKKMYFSSFGADPKKRMPVIDGIIGLSVIEEYRRANASRLAAAVNSCEYNPFFYLLSRYYSDGLCAEMSTTSQLPPLAIVHPYHSERIRAQHGAFTVFPYYYYDKNTPSGKLVDQAKKLNIDLRAMEYQRVLQPFIFKIRICHPDRLARDLMLTGEKVSSIYPETERYSNDIESTQYHV